MGTSTIIAVFEKVGTRELRHVKNSCVVYSEDLTPNNNATRPPCLFAHTKTCESHTHGKQGCAHIGSNEHVVQQLFSLQPIMRGKKISTDLKHTILALGDFHSVSEIEALTAVSHRQIYRIRKSWETTGCVELEHPGKRTGRPCFLTTDEEAVCSPSVF